MQQPFRGEPFGKGAQGLLVISAGQEGFSAPRGSLANQNIPYQSGELREDGADILPRLVELSQLGERSFRVSLADSVQDMGRFQIACKAKGLQNALPADLTAGNSALIQQRQGVPQGAVRQTGQQRSTVGGQINAFLLGYRLKTVLDVRRKDALEGEPLTAGEDGGGDLVELRRCQNKDQVFGGLLQNLQKGVEGRC